MVSQGLTAQATPVPPPGRTTRIRADRVLVLAPHYDDEVIGCGGLLAQLAADGATIDVLFVSDGSGGVEEVVDAPGYAARRRSESRAAAEVLGAASTRTLDLPDGRLEAHTEEAAAAIDAALLAQRPDLLLAPSPTEVTADHRAVFSALHTALSVIRSDDSCHAIARRLRVLLYEVNHTGHPDVLVDVSHELDTIDAALRCYPSQLERHDYLGVAMGLRRFRTLTLSGVAAAEGYRRLTLPDFVTRSHDQLVNDLGGTTATRPEPGGPVVSLVVRTRNRPLLLPEALDSIAHSTYRAIEVVLVDDGDTPPRPPVDYPFPIVVVSSGGRGPAAAAQAGVERASGRLLGFVDDDDLVAPEHVSRLVAGISRSGTRAVYSDAAVGLYRLDARGRWRCRERRVPYSRDFDPDLLLVDNYIPFNTVLFERSLAAEIGPFDATLPRLEDWDYLIRMAGRTPLHHVRKVTCEYRLFEDGGHHQMGAAPFENRGLLADRERVMAKHHQRLTPERLARATAVLSAELRRRTDDNRELLAELAGDETPIGRALRSAVSRLRAAWRRRRSPV